MTTTDKHVTEPLLRPDDVAEILNISARQVRRLAHKGKIPHVVIGFMYRFDRADIERWITDHWITDQPTKAPDVGA